MKQPAVRAADWRMAVQLPLTAGVIIRTRDRRLKKIADKPGFGAMLGTLAAGSKRTTVVALLAVHRTLHSGPSRYGRAQTHQTDRRPPSDPPEQTWLMASCSRVGSGTPPLRRPTPRPTSRP